MLKRPGTAWKTLIHTVDAGGMVSWIAYIICGNAWPVGEGQGKAWESTLTELFGKRLDTMSATEAGSAILSKWEQWRTPY